MSRPLLIRTHLHPYHITSRCNNQEFFPLLLPEIWDIMIDRLYKVHQHHHLAIHAFVLMGNHFHLLCHTPKSNLDQAMHDFQRNTSYIISQRAKRTNPLWGARYKWSLISSQAHYYQVYRYIFQNPIRAKIVSGVEDYPYSTLATRVPFPLHSFVPMAFGGHEGEVRWLNEKFGTEEQELIRLGLKKHQFDVNRRKAKIFMKLSVPET